MRKPILFLCLYCVAMAAMATPATLVIHPDRVVRKVDRSALLGTNLAPWHEPVSFENVRFKSLMQGWAPGVIRLPGGSWSNELYWNGNGVRGADGTLDASRHVDGRWIIDYSAYAPGFRIHGTGQELSDYHGVIDVLTEHKIAESLGAAQMVTVNAGTGTVEMAVEWLKWARLQKGFNVPYWEIGNELNGKWEMGHFLPDGSHMTGEVYAAMFIEYVEALKAVDPSVKVGGPACSDLELAFVEDLIRIAGDKLDFVSVHAYPVGGARTTIEGKFTDIGQLPVAMKKIRGWIEAYHPERSGEIEIAVTEWNMKVNEDRDTADLINGLWTAVWIGNMFEEGISLATQWDLFTSTEKGGHGALHVQESRLVPKSHYWANYLWGNYMGDTMVAHEAAYLDGVDVFATRSDSALQVMLVNRNPDTEAVVAIEVPDTMKLSEEGRVVIFSSREYLWDPHHHKPVYSNPPTVVPLAPGGLSAVNVPAFSIQIVELPLAGEAAVADPSLFDALAPRLILLAPKQAPADLPLELVVAVVNDAGTRGHQAAIGTVEISVSGNATPAHSTLQLKQSVGRVFLEPHGSGPLTVAVNAGPLETSCEIELMAVASRERIIWTFDNPVAEWGVDSTFAVSMNPTVRPNEFVASVSMETVQPETNNGTLLSFRRFPADLERGRIGGLIGEIMASKDYVCTDEAARVDIVLQSKADHWIIIGSIPLAAMREQWVPLKLELNDARVLEAMKRMYALRFVIQSDEPVTGDIYFDNLGFLMRTFPTE